MRRKAEQKNIVDINRKMNGEKVRKIRAEAARLKQKAARKEINTYKSASFQIVTIDFYYFCFKKKWF